MTWQSIRCCKASIESQSNTSVDDSKAANMSLRGRVHDLFSIGRCVFIGLCFSIEWKLPPPACPGTTGIYDTNVSRMTMWDRFHWLGEQSIDSIAFEGLACVAIIGWQTSRYLRCYTFHHCGGHESGKFRASFACWSMVKKQWTLQRDDKESVQFKVRERATSQSHLLVQTSNKWNSEV